MEVPRFFTATKPWGTRMQPAWNARRASSSHAYDEEGSATDFKNVLITL
jgi:hypothetical protein